MTEQSCQTCKHAIVMPWVKPCASCMDNYQNASEVSNWEPEKSDAVKDLKFGQGYSLSAEMIKIGREREKQLTAKFAQCGWSQTLFNSFLDQLPPEEVGRMFGAVFREREIIYDANQKQILKFYEGGHLAMPYKQGEK